MKKAGFLFFCLVMMNIVTAREIFFISRPPGAEVWFEGEKLGKTPLRITGEERAFSFFNDSEKSFSFIFYKEFFEGELVKSIISRESMRIEVDLTPQTQLPGYKGRFLNRFELSLSRLAREADEILLQCLMDELMAKYGGPVKEPESLPSEVKASYRKNPWFDPQDMDLVDKKNYLVLCLLMKETPEEKAFKQMLLAKGEISIELNSVFRHISFSGSGEGLFRTEDDSNPYWYEAAQEIQWRLERNWVIFWVPGEPAVYYFPVAEGDEGTLLVHPYDANQEISLEIIYPGRN